MNSETLLAWNHFNPVRVHVGCGALRSSAHLLDRDRDWLVLTSRGFTRRGTSALVEWILRDTGAARVVVEDGLLPNPQLSDLERLATRAKEFAPTAILALGGGSVLDAAKVTAVLLGGDDGQLTESLRSDQPQAWSRQIPLVVVPTTAGTGSEVTPFATVWDSISCRKYSVSGDAVFPDLALLDPELTLTLPRDETLFGGLDATSHALESLWNKNATPLTRALSFAALERIRRALPGALRDPGQVHHRHAMQEASLLAGMAISQTRTAIAHAISYPLTLHHGVPHGLACSFTLPSLLARHSTALSRNDQEQRVLASTESMLRSLDLPEELARYASPAEINELESEMCAPGRIENFLFETQPGDVLRYE